MSSSSTTDETLRIVLIVIAVIVLGPVLLMVLMLPMMGVWGGMMGGFGRAGITPLWSIVMMLIWLVVLVGGGYLVYRWVSGNELGSRDPALEELRVAYARGDVSDEEYQERRSRLEDE